MTAGRSVYSEELTLERLEAYVRLAGPVTIRQVVWRFAVANKRAYELLSESENLVKIINIGERIRWIHKAKM